MAITSAILNNTDTKDIYTSTGSNAIVTIAVCNTGTGDPTDESVDLCYLDLFAVAYPDQPDVPGKVGAPGTYTGNQVVSKLAIPAGETVFFSDEKIVLSNSDRIVAQASVGGLLSITVSTLAV